MRYKNATLTMRLTLIFGLIALISGCGGLPPAPPYPYYSTYGSREAMIAEAQRKSDALEKYIKDWMDGRVPAQIPNELLLTGPDPVWTNLRLVKPAEIGSVKQWVVRPSRTIDWNGEPVSFGDPHVTYMVVPNLFAPKGTKVHVEGEFPHSRYFSLQVTPPFDPNNYRWNSIGGVPEVPLFDVDIEPLPFHTNPFRPGADRNAFLRSYKATFVMEIGDPVALNGSAFKPPYYRAPGNTRYGGAISYQGPWSDPNWNGGNHPGHKRGVWDYGQIWLRYYAPDKATGSLAGVRIPRVTYELPDGRQFYIVGDVQQSENAANKPEPISQTPPIEPGASQGPNVGWIKSWGITRGGFIGAATSADPAGNLNFFTKPYIRDLDRGVFARGEELPAPGNYEPQATTAAGVSYLNRGMAVGTGKVFVLTGQLPATPRTRNGEPVMQRAQARYWSLTSYDNTVDLEKLQQAPSFGAPVTSIMDDEIVTDANGRFVIVYSRAEDRPANATAANGVTWVNWGPTSSQGFVLRWLSIYPDWTFDKAPDEAHLQRESDWASDKYNPELLGRNNQNGFLGKYQPLAHYLTKQQFEQIGNQVTPDKVPVWQPTP